LIRLLWTAVCCDGVVCMIFMSLTLHYRSFLFFFFNDTATTEIYTLSLHDALPISRPERVGEGHEQRGAGVRARAVGQDDAVASRSEEHTSELQSRFDLVCRLLLEKKKKKKIRQRMIASVTEINEHLADIKSHMPEH